MYYFSNKSSSFSYRNITIQDVYSELLSRLPGTTVKPPNSDRIGDGTFSLLPEVGPLIGSSVNAIICDKALGKIELKVHPLMHVLLWLSERCFFLLKSQLPSVWLLLANLMMGS